MHAMSAHPAKPFSEIVSKEALGLRLRAIRKKKGFTLKALSAQSGVALSTLSKAELGQTSLSYEKFVAISWALGVDMSELFESKGPHDDAHDSILTSADATPKTYSTDNYEIKFLFGDSAQRIMIPMQAKILSRKLEDFEDYIRHPGQEFVMVLSGAVQIHFENATIITLKKSESAYFNSTLGHKYLSISKEPADILTICTNIDNTKAVPPP
ncbi:XRE family transcriptional regulator [Paralcaligenes ginsengisoli]